MSPVRAAWPRILSISFSPIHLDSRVMRQIEVLRAHGDVTTVGYGPTPEGVERHIRVPDGAASLPATVVGVARLALHRHEAVELKAPGEKAVLREVVGLGPYDLVVANDARALPLAFAAAAGAPVYADMHEWAAEERATVLVWRLLVGPYMEHLSRKYLPRTAALTSVSPGLASLYTERYGVPAGVVRNAPDYQDLRPSPVETDRIRLVHSGTADVERNIMELIEATERLGPRFSLDLYLLEVPGGHLAQIRKRARTSPRVTVHDPVPPNSLPGVLNQYDLGVFLYPLRTLSHVHHLPNKLFDFVQARLGLVFSAAPEIDVLISRYGLGLTTDGTTADALVDSLAGLTVDDVARFKDASDRAAHEFSSELSGAVQHDLVKGLLDRAEQRSPEDTKGVSLD